MCVVTQDLCMIAGCDFFFDLQYLEDDETTPIDLTGSTAILQLLDSTDSPAAEVTLTGGITVPLQGQMQFSLDGSQTQDLLELPALTKDFVGDVHLTYPDTTCEIILRVTATVDQGRFRP